MPERLGAKSALVLLAVLLASPHSAQAADGNRIAYGAGMLTCGEWQKYRVTGDKSATAQLEAVNRPVNLALTHMWNGPGCKIFLWLNKG